MNLHRFETIVRDPCRTQADIENMRRNALDKGEIECAKIASEVLCARFPKRSKRGGGATPTTARFLDETREFGCGKDAYLWLVAKLLAHRADALDRYLAHFQRSDSRSQGCRFARSPLGLFPPGSKRRDNPAHCAELGSGLFADVNLSHDDKFKALIQLSFCVELEFAEHWDFRVTGATHKLRDHQEAVRIARELLEEFLRL